MHTTSTKSTGHDWAYVCKTTLFGCNFPGAMAYRYQELNLVGQVIFFPQKSSEEVMKDLDVSPSDEPYLIRRREV